MAGRKDGSSKQRTRGETEASRGTTRSMAQSRGDTPAQNREDKAQARNESALGGSDDSPRKRERAGASTGGQRATKVGKGEVLPQSRQTAQDECPPNPSDDE